MKTIFESNIGATGVLIETERLVLRTYHAGMVTPAHVAWLNNPEVVRYSEQRHIGHTLESQHSYVNNLWTNPGSIIWAVFPIPVDGFRSAIGTMAAHCNLPNKTADMGILIGKEHWDKGYGLEAWNAVMAWLFKHAMRKVTAGCMSKNKSMLRVCIKSGMVADGFRPNHFLLDGVPVDLIYYARFA